MSKILIENFRFEKIIPTSNQVYSLYQLLVNRKYSISHKKIPSYEEHNEFVFNNPYLVWYILYKNDTTVGSFYIQTDNSIGINLNDTNEDDLLIVIDYVKKNYKPLPAINSFRSSDFFINIPSSNHSIIKILNKLKKKKLQISFLI